MLVEGTHVVTNATRERVFEALADPGVLARTLPGCRELAVIDTDSYSLAVEAGVGAARGMYQGQVSIDERVAPRLYVATLDARGGPGSVKARLRAELEARGEDTAVAYSVDSELVGSIAGVGQRVLAGVARRTSADFFDAIERDLAAATAGGGAPPEAAAEPATRAVEEPPGAPRSGEVSGGQVFQGRAALEREADVKVRWLLRGTVLGFLITAASFVLARVI
jgi:uncharacterized protein